MSKETNEDFPAPAIAAIALDHRGGGVLPEDRSMLSVICEANDIAQRRGLNLSAQHALVIAAVMRLEPDLNATVVERLVSALTDTGGWL
ncbi:MAG: hypothetical protein RLZZ501_809 [Pseudomonadota bacterium]